MRGLLLQAPTVAAQPLPGAHARTVQHATAPHQTGPKHHLGLHALLQRQGTPLVLSQCCALSQKDQGWFVFFRCFVLGFIQHAQRGFDARFQRGAFVAQQSVQVGLKVRVGSPSGAQVERHGVGRRVATVRGAVERGLVGDRGVLQQLNLSKNKDQKKNSKPKIKNGSRKPIPKESSLLLRPIASIHQ